MSVELPSALPRGAFAKSVLMSANDIIHWSMLCDKLGKVVEGDAKAYGVELVTKDLSGVLEAAKNGIIQVYFLIVGWDGGQPQFAGGAIEFPTIMTEWNGKDFEHYPAVYAEENYVSAEVSEEFRKRTKDESNPKGVGLGRFFIHQRILQSVINGSDCAPFGMPSRGCVGEMDPNNDAVNSILGKLDPSFRDDSGVILELNSAAVCVHRNSEVAVTIDNVASNIDGQNIVVQPAAFVASWSSPRGERIVASFTRAISTFTGKTVVRVQFASNRNIPAQDQLEDAMAGLISAGQAEIGNRKWLTRESGAPGPIDVPMRIHAFAEPRLVAALRELGATTRVVGARTLVPIVTDFKRVSTDALGITLPTPRQLTLVRTAA
jgi:hypothetical protein